MGSFSPVAYERAEIARDMEYTKQNVIDDSIQQSMISAGNTCFKDAFDDTEYSDEELSNAIDQIPDDDTDRDEEIERIVNAKKDLDIDGIIGIDDSDDFEEEESEEE